MRVAISTVAAALIGVLAATTGQAQTAPPIDDPEATAVAPLVISVPTPGPAWWRATKGESTVWILGLPAAGTPSKLWWDSRALDRRLSGAKALLVAPESRIVSEGAANKRLLWMDASLAQGGEAAEIVTRFKAALARVDRPEWQVSNLAPAYAAQRLQTTFEDKAKLRGNMQADVIRRARRVRVSVLRPAPHTVASFSLAEMRDLSRPGLRTCFEASLAYVGASPDVYAAAAEGWAKADLTAALAGPREPWGVCTNALNAGASRYAIRAQVRAIEAQLATPGKAVAIAPLRQIVAKEGIVSALREAGYEVEGPEAADR